MSIITKYNRISYIYDMMESLVEYLMFGKWRKQILSDLSGLVLDIGVGTGKNLKYYPDNCKIVGMDVSSKMLEHAKKRAENLDNVSLFVMDGEHLAFENHSFDYVITTFVLCSIPDPVAALKEMKRVCKPDGMVINMEHMKSKHAILSMIEDIFNPLTFGTMGVNINRKTVENIKKAGLNKISEQNLAIKDVFRLIKSKP
ncbi:MAG TPA: class I SAM-dependent methyltransferase [Candidatus Nanoarchaeia archaeon]|nr:class I SAM-dependent methyltransferase [Candidatus Nanoarchaeia archaeon]